MLASSLLLLLFLIPSDDALKISGSVSNMPSEINVVYVGKFCYSAGEGRFQGSFEASEGTQLVIYDDQSFSWPFVVNSDNCTEQQLAAKAYWVSLNTSIVTQVDSTVTEGYNRWWYAAFLNCNGIVSVEDYNLEFVNGDSNQLGENQIGLPSVYGFFFCLLLLYVTAIGVVPKLRVFFIHPMSAILMVSVCVECFSRLILMAYYVTVSTQGSMMVSMMGFGTWLDQLAQMVLMGLFLLLCFGWNFNGFPNYAKITILTCLFCYTIFGLFLVIWAVTVFEMYWFVDAILATPWGIFLTCVRVVILVIGLGAAVGTIRRERRMERRSWMIKFIAIETIWQVTYIVGVLVANALPSWLQAKYLWTFVSIINSVNFTALLIIMRPQWVGDLFGSPLGPSTLTGVTEEFLDESGENK